MQQGTPEYQDLQATIDKAKPYEEAQNTLQIIASLSIAWKGNIRIGDDVISLGMNEGELREARKILMDAYMNPEKYKAEKTVYGLLAITLTADPEKLTDEKDIKLRRDLDRAINGDEKALRELQNYFREKAHDYDLAYNVLTGNVDYQNLDEEDKKTTLRGLYVGGEFEPYLLHKISTLYPYLMNIETFNLQDFTKVLGDIGVDQATFASERRDIRDVYSSPPKSLKELKIRILCAY
ncbi:MAG: hypothetical protein QXX46_04885 [Candidatus Anstonellales archaeon]